MKLASVLSAFGIGPKTLPQAQDTIAMAKSTLDSIDAMFTAAGLKLEAMLEAGPDALKSHIASVAATDAALAEANAENVRLKATLDESGKRAEQIAARAAAAESVIVAIGGNAETKPAEFAALLEAHVKKAAALELAKAGHTPVAVAPDAAAKTGPAASATRDEHYAHMGTLPEAEQHAYFKKHLARKF